jgi:hypothetical protein
MDQPIPNLTLKEFEDGFGMINRGFVARRKHQSTCY